MNQSSNNQAVLTGLANKSSEIDWNRWIPLITIAGFFLAQTAVMLTLLVFLLNRIDDKVQPVLVKSYENGERLAKIETEIDGLKSKVNDLESKLLSVEGKLLSVEGKLLSVDGKIDTLIDLQKSNGQ